MGELSEFPRLRAIAAARAVDVAALASTPYRKAARIRGIPGDPAGLALEFEDLKNYLQQVQRYKTEPLIKRAVFGGYCVGQTLSLCEIVNGQPEARLSLRDIFEQVAAASSTATTRPSTSSNRAAGARIARYTPADARRDARMGGGSAGTVPFENGGNPIEMPNFLHFLPARLHWGRLRTAFTRSRGA